MDPREIILDDPDEATEPTPEVEGDSIDPDEFFAKNAFRIVYQTNNFFLPQIRDLIDKGEVMNLRPEYQRRLRWRTPQKSRLIESLLLNIPVPPVFFYESEAARYEVMDGQQRLNAVKEFLSGDFALIGLQVLKPLNGLRYSRCPPRIKRGLDRASLSAIVLLLESDSEKTAAERLTLTDIRRFIFDRLNTGGTKLNQQEIRNALHPGHFNKMLIDLTRFTEFTRVFDIPPYTEADPNEYYENEERQKNSLYATMGDCQIVLRYFALRDHQNIRGSMKSMLDRTMQEGTKISADVARELATEFKERFLFLFQLFDGEPFLLLPDEKKRVRVSAALYDAAMVAINNLWPHQEKIMADKNGVQMRLNAALGKPESAIIVTGRGNTAQAVRDRIALLELVFFPKVDS